MKMTIHKSFNLWKNMFGRNKIPKAIRVAWQVLIHMNIPASTTPGQNTTVMLASLKDGGPTLQ